MISSSYIILLAWKVLRNDSTVLGGRNPTPLKKTSSDIMLTSPFCVVTCGCNNYIEKLVTGCSRERVSHLGRKQMSNAMLHSVRSPFHSAVTSVAPRFSDICVRRISNQRDSEKYTSEDLETFRRRRKTDWKRRQGVGQFCDILVVSELSNSRDNLSLIMS